MADIKVSLYRASSRLGLQLNHKIRIIGGKKVVQISVQKLGLTPLAPLLIANVHQALNEEGNCRFSDSYLKMRLINVYIYTYTGWSNSFILILLFRNPGEM